MKHDEATAQPAPLGQVERGVGRPVPQRHKLALECLYDDNTKTLMSKGHHAETEFMAACEVWNGGPMTGWGKVRHVWLRNTPDSSGDYEFKVWPAEPNSRGAYPATQMVDDPSYDHD